MERSEEMFVCTRSFCTSILYSQLQLDDHIREKHKTADNNTKSLEEEFSFDDDELNEEIDEEFFEFEAEEETNEELFEFEAVEEPNKPRGEKENEEKIAIEININPKDLMFLNKNLKRTKNELKGEIKETKKVSYQKREGRIFLIKSRSSFKLEDIEKALPLSEENKKEFQVLIEEGRDEEIFIKMFGELNTNRKWICIFHKFGDFFGSRKEFESHFQREHRDRIIYTCELCRKKWNSFTKYKVHLKENHFMDNKCYDCNFSFSNPVKLETHLLKVHGQGGFPCDFCSKKLSTRKYLKVHKAANHSGQNYHCNTCGKSFYTKLRVEIHEKTHTRIKIRKSRQIPLKMTARKPKIKEERTRTCEECGKTFRRGDNFLDHMRFHRKDESLVCKQCGKMYHSLKAVKHHVKTVHERIKEFPCEEKGCTFRACNKWKVQRHVRTVHSNDFDTCLICQKNTKSEYHHVTSAHKTEIPWKEYVKMKKEKKEI